MTTENRWSLGTVEVGTVHVQWIPIYSELEKKTGYKVEVRATSRDT